MTRSAVGLPLEGPWTQGGVTVTCIQAASEELVTEFWPVYEEAFGPLRIRAAARQVLTFEEFTAEISDPRVWKYVAADAEGNLIGLTTLTSDLSTVPWISPEYFAHHYPEQSARQAVFYMGFTMVKPTLQRSRVFVAMLGPAVLRVASGRGVCAWDVCGFNDATIAAGIERHIHRLAEVEVATVDVQTYFAAITTGVLKD